MALLRENGGFDDRASPSIEIAVRPESIPRVPHLATSLEMDLLTGAVLCRVVVHTRGKFELADKDETTEGEPADGMTDETRHRGYDRARLTVTTTR